MVDSKVSPTTGDLEEEKYTGLYNTLHTKSVDSKEKISKNV